jgi:putative transposase
MIEAATVKHPEVALKGLCKLFTVSRSWYYDKPKAERRAMEDVALRDAIERIVLEFPGYGYRRVAEALRREGWIVNHKKVLRVMRKESLLCQLKRRFKPTTASSHPFGTHPNLIKDASVGIPDRAWLSDITHVRLPTSFCYLASIIDDLLSLLRRLGPLTVDRHPPDLIRSGDGASLAPAGLGVDPPL